MTVVSADYQALAQAIIDRLVSISGKELALSRAAKATGLSIDENGRIISITSSGVQALESLVLSYSQLLGPVAVSLAKNAIAPLAEKNPKIDLPPLLR